MAQSHLAISVSQSTKPGQTQLWSPVILWVLVHFKRFHFFVKVRYLSLWIEVACRCHRCGAPSPSSIPLVVTSHASFRGLALPVFHFPVSQWHHLKRFYFNFSSISSQTLWCVHSTVPPLISPLQVVIAMVTRRAHVKLIVKVNIQTLAFTLPK